MKKIFTLAAIALFTITSCSDNDSDSTTTPTPEETLVLVKKTITDTYEGDLVTRIFTYNGNKIVSTESDNGESDQWYYDTNNRLVLIKYYEDGILAYEDVYEYNSNGQLATNYWKEMTSDYAEKTTYTYNANGTISTLETWGDLTSQTDVDGTGVITTSDGNIMQYAFTNGTTEINSFTFDDKNEPFKNIAGFDAYILSVPEGGVNNMLTSAKGGNIDLSITHTYNSNNYPTVSIVSSEEDTDTETTQYFYE